MTREILIALRMTLVTLVLTGLAYPLAMTGLAQVLFPARANGSLVTDAAGHTVGSELIAQAFTKPGYFQPRPSAAGNGYDAANSAGSNLGPTSQKLRDRVVADVQRLQKENPDAAGPVPAELVTTSASGLDPDLSPEAARWQIPRVAKARGRTVAEMQSLVDEGVRGRTLGFLGEPTVNVLRLNLALDQRFAPTGAGR
jgi:K+-transporting ATPase ATPase C chain